jgi:hypothetical protein
MLQTAPFDALCSLRASFQRGSWQQAYQVPTHLSALGSGIYTQAERGPSIALYSFNTLAYLTSLINLCSQSQTST